MKLLSLAGLCLALGMGCQNALPVQASPEAEVPQPVQVLLEEEEPMPSFLELVAPGVWVHSTIREVKGFGTVLSNGLVVASGDEALLVDAGWGEEPVRETRLILAETGRVSGASVRRAVFSHHHADSVEGIEALREVGIPTHASSMTADLMDVAGWGRPDSLLTQGDSWALSYGDRQLEVFYAGPGHTVDNVVVYVPSARVLYTGCLVRPGESNSLGNTADADIEVWAESVARVRERYRGRVDIVVPSHGPPGGPEFLDHTIELVEAHRGRPVGG